MAKPSIIAGGRAMSRRDQAKIDAREPVFAGVEPDVICIAKATDWQDNTSYPGWEPEAGATAYFKGIAGTMPAHFLTDGGFLWIIVSGTFGNNSANPTLLVKLQAWRDFYGAVPAATYVGPDDALGSLGWGFTNSATGTGPQFTEGGRFLLDVRVMSLGKNAAKTLLGVGSFRVSAIYPQHGGMNGALPSEDRIEIFDTYALDLEPEYTLTIDMTGRVTATGTDDLHVDKMEIWGFGGRRGALGIFP